MDATTCESLILVLSLTKEWRKCLKLLEDIKISSNPTAMASSAVVAASFRNQEPEIAWNILNYMSGLCLMNFSIFVFTVLLIFTELGQTPTKVVYESFGKWCKNCNNWQLELDKFLLLHQYNNWPIKQEIAQVLQKDFSNLASSNAFSMISERYK